MLFKIKQISKRLASLGALLIIASCLIFLGACKGGGGSGGAANPGGGSTPPSATITIPSQAWTDDTAEVTHPMHPILHPPKFLKNIGIPIAPYAADNGVVPEAGKAGSILFFEDQFIRAPFWQFGTVVLDQDGNPKYLAEFDYYLQPGTQISAAASGTYYDSGDPGEMGIKVNLEGRQFMISYDHVEKIRNFQEGETINEGDILGTGIQRSVGLEFPYINVDWFEFQIFDLDFHLYVCPHVRVP